MIVEARKKNEPSWNDRRRNELPSAEEKKKSNRESQSQHRVPQRLQMRAALRRIGVDVDLGCGNEMNETEDSSS